MKHRPILTLLAFLAVVTVVRVLVAARTDLSPDEAYYFAWALQPQAGYLDHPPLVAWLIHASCMAFGSSELAVRIPAILAGFLTPLLVFFIAIELRASAGWALIAAVVSILTPLASAGAVIITPDTPLGLFWAAALLMLARIVNRDDAPQSRRIAESAAAGVFVGLCLLSKYTGALIVLSVVLYLPFAPRKKSAAMWLAAVPLAAAFVVYLPNLVYNIGGGFKSMGFQAGHAFSMKEGHELIHFPEFLGGQAGVAGPFVFAGMFWIVRRFFSGGVPPAARLAQIAALVPFVLPILVSLYNKVEPNWPAAAYVAAVPLLASMMSVAEPVTRRMKRVVMGAIAYGVIVTAVIHVHALLPFLPIPIEKDPVVQQLHGWKEITENVWKVVSQVPDAKKKAPAAFSYRICAELFYYTGGRLQPLCMDKRFIGEGDLPLAGADRWIAIEQYPAKKADAVMKLMCKNGYKRDGVVADWAGHPLRRLDVMWCE
ncbi:MAG: glycosyltransferase family 39 protein [Deltaproteobacteria bacterium]|nr:glycosyltransferase family 39 protein [Deltaproteobacteria bacterium]